MSQKTVHDFFQNLEVDNTLKEQVKNSGLGVTGDSQEEVRIIPENILRIACDRGYEFNEEELYAYIQSANGSRGLRMEESIIEELSEEELEGVAGGCPCAIPILILIILLQ